MWPTIAILSAILLLWVFALWRREKHARVDDAARADRERAEAEAQYRASINSSRAEQQTLFNSMAEGVLLLDAEGKVRLSNEAFNGFFELKSSISGRSLMEAVRSHEIQGLYQRTLIEGQVQDCELNPTSLKERVLQVNSAAILDQSNRQQGMILVFHDLTRLKQLENTRRDFVANVSHELRTPLSLIKGFVETLIDGAKDDPEVAARFLRTIEKHADRLTFLIEDLLTLSHLESGQSVMNLQEVVLKPIVARVVEDLGSRAGARSISLKDNVAAGIRVQADPARLQQVLFNLVHNAIKYGREHGSVEIDARVPVEGMLEVSVHDDGAGVPKEAQERVFERFYRVDKARSREQGGTGLGLAIVKHIVQSHGGECWVRSEPGKGATFYITLPMPM